MARQAKATVYIDANASGMRRGVEDAERSLNRLHSSGSKALKGLSIAATATGAVAFTGLAAAIATGTRELLAQEKATAQTAAVIKSTGGAANVTKKEIEGLASALQAQTGVADDAIQANENLLLTFTNIRNEAGRGNDVFTQATKTVLDMSVALGQDGKSSAIQLGKALNDPIAGVSALAEVGVTFTKQQKEQITTLVESGKRLDAQKVILRELGKEFGGSAKAQANTTAGQLARIQRAWEDVSEGLVREFLPIITDVARGVLRNMDKVKAVFEGLAVFVKGVIRFIRALFEGDWKRAWDIAADGAGKSLKAIIIIAQKILLPLAVKLGEKIVEGIQEGIRKGLAQLPGGRFLNNALGLGTSGGGRVPLQLQTAGQNPGYLPTRGATPGLAIGGVIPGRFDGRDDVPVRLSRGEVVLNPTQQRIVGIDRIMSTLRATGGVVGGSAFAAGGVIGAVRGVGSMIQGAASFARSQVGEPYVWGAGHSYGDSRGWDCSGFASNVAARVPGYTGGIGTTMTLYPRSKPASGREPVVFGFSGMEQSDPSKQHMGIRVGGVWYDAGSGGVETGRTRWPSGLRIPPGLEGLSSGDLGDLGSGVTPDRPAPLLSRKTLQAIISRGIGTRGAPLSPADAASGTISARHRDDSLQDKQARRAGETGARGAGVTNPDLIAAAGEKQVMETRRREVEQDTATVKKAMRQVGVQIERQKVHRKKMYAALRKAHTRAEQDRFIAAIAADNQAIRDLWDEYHGLMRQFADLQAEAKELNFDIGELSAEIAAMPTAAPSDTSSGSDAGATSADDQARIDQATGRAETAERGAAAGGAFIRALFGSSTIDPGSGSVNVNVMVEGSLVHQGELARFIAGALGTQGSPGGSRVVSPA